MFDDPIGFNSPSKQRGYMFHGLWLFQEETTPSVLECQVRATITVELCVNELLLQVFAVAGGC